MSTEQFNDAGTPAFPTGYGQFDTHIKVKSDGTPRRSDTAGTAYDLVTGPKIIEMVKNPLNVHKKDAHWFIPSTYAEHDARNHDAQRQHGIFRWLTLDVDDNDVHIDNVAEALRQVVGDAHWLIYSSKSATKDEKKWRALVPLKNDLAGMDFADTQTAFFDLLKEASVGTLIPDVVFARPAQLVYLPNRGEFYEHKINEGAGLLDLSPDHKITHAREAMRAKNAAVEAAVKAERDKREAYRNLNMQGVEVSPIEHFNAEHSVSGLLARYGYQQKGASDNWRSPMQQTKGHATRDYGDYWVSLSGSDGVAEIGAPVRGGGENKDKFSCRFGDAFDLYVYFEHANDRKAAVRTYAKEAGLNSQREAIHKANDLSDFEVVPTLPTQEGVAEAKRAAKINRFLQGVFAASDLEGQNVPPRSWHVQDLIPSNTVTLFSGDGGTGKSLVALQLAVSTALGRPWLRMPVKEGSALYLSAEDDKEELHRRLDDIAQAECVGVAELQNLKCRSLAGEDALLATLNKGGTLEPTFLLDAIDDLLKRDQPDLLVLDTLADYFPGNENDRAQARQFVGILRGLAIWHRCAVFMLAHPSLTGISSGTGTSGSTGWNNSVRSRLYLSRVKQDGYESNPDARVLQTMKSNYARIGAEIALTWQNGVFIADAPVTGLDRMAASAKAERLFLTFLRQFEEQGRRVNHAGGQSYAPKVFAAHPDAEGVSKRAFMQAMENLMASGKVTISVDGPPSKRRQFLVVAE